MEQFLSIRVDPDCNSESQEKRWDDLLGMVCKALGIRILLVFNIEDIDMIF